MSGRWPPESGLPAPGADGNVLTSTGTGWASEAIPTADPPWDYGLVYQSTTVGIGWGYLGGAMVFAGTAGTFAPSVSVPFGGNLGVARAPYSRTGTNPSLRAAAGVTIDAPNCVHQIAAESISGTGGTIALGWWQSPGDVALGAIQGLGLVSSASASAPWSGSTTWRVCYNRGAGLVHVADTGIARTAGSTPAPFTLLYIEWDEASRTLRTKRGDTDEIVASYDCAGASPRDGTSVGAPPLICASGVTSPSVSLDFLRTRGRVGGGAWSA